MFMWEEDRFHLALSIPGAVMQRMRKAAETLAEASVAAAVSLGEHSLRSGVVAVRVGRLDGGGLGRWHRTPRNLRQGRTALYTKRVMNSSLT